MRIRTALLLLAAVCVPVAAFAQEAPPPSQYTAPANTEGFDNYVSGYYNFNFGGNLFKDREESSTGGYGGALTFWGRGKFSAELDFNYNPQFFGPKNDAGDNNLMTFTFSGIIGPWINQGGSQRVRPYIVVGGGLMRSTIKEFATVGWKDTKNLGVVDFGGGVLYFFHPRVGVRGDIRYRWGVGANSDEKGWGLIDNWTYWRGAIGIALAF